MQNPEIVRKRLGEKIRYLREQEGWSQDHLSLKAGLARAFVGEAERGQRDLRLKSLCKFADAFRITLPELFAGTDDLSNAGKRKR